MAMRSRGGGLGTPRRGGGGGRAGVVRPVYEDFKPVSEWEQDDASHILNIYLPGFTKEQIKVSTEGKNTIRVRGERHVAGNKWNRFVEEFQVPDNGEMNSVRAKFQGGILNIAVPKKEPAKPQYVIPPEPKARDTEKQYAPQKGQDKVSSEASTSQTKDEIGRLPQKLSGDQHTRQEGHDKDFPTVFEKILEPRKASSDPNHQRDKRKITPLRDTNVVSQEAKESINEYRQKDIASEKQDKITENSVYNDEQKKTAVSKELPEVDLAKKTKLEKDGPMSVPSSMKKGNCW